MTPGGLVFLAMVVLLGAHLLPLWAGHHAGVVAERELRRESARIRLADRSQPRVLLSAGRPALTTSARIGALASAQRDLAHQRRGMRRRRSARAVAMAAGLVAVVAAVACAVAGVVPWWSVAVGGCWLATATMAGVLGAAGDRRRLTAAREQVRTAAALQPRVTPQVRAVALFDRGADAEPLPTPRRDAVTGGMWTPVTVPRPTYATAARVARPPVLPWVAEAAPEPAPAPARPVPSEAPPQVERREEPPPARRAATG